MAGKPHLIEPGSVFGKLTVLDLGPRASNGKSGTVATFSCQCECGRKKNVTKSNLVHGRTRSCGCVVPRLGTATILTAGEVFGNLIVIGPGERHVRKSGYTNPTSVCLCVCGAQTTVRNDYLRGGNTRSCGCSSIDRNGESKTIEYRTWKGILHRCLNPSSQGYAAYGAKGITVCERWRNSYEDFLADMGRRPSEKHSIDRFPLQMGNYEPGNCRWATDEEQANNRQTNRLLESGKEIKSIAQWAYLRGWSDSTILTRLSNGWSINDALTVLPDRSNKRLRKYIRHYKEN